MRYLRTNTAVIKAVGPFIGTDGVTLKTALTITNERITLSADTDAGSAPTLILDNITGATSGTANDLNYITGQDNAMMQIELAAADVNRLGSVRLTITDAANHLPVIENFTILPAVIFDSLVLGTDLLQVDVTQLLGTAWLTPGTAGTPDVNTKLAGGTAWNSGAIGDGTFATTAGPISKLGIVDQGTAQAVTGTTIRLRSAAAFADDELIGATVYIVSATTGAGQARIITDYASSTDTATVDTWTTTPTGTIVYQVFASAPGSTSVPAPVNAVQFAGQTITAAAGVTLPSSVASPTNITAATGIVLSGVTHTGAVIPTVTTTTTATNLTNAPTSGDLTATMKTSIGTAVAASAVASVTGNVGGNVTGSVGSLATQAKADVNAEVLDVLATDTFAEPSSIAAATSTLKDKINFIFQYLRNKRTQTATTETLRNDGDSGSIGTRTVSDDGTTMTKGKIS